VGSRGAHEHGRVSACDSPPHHSHDVSACSVVDLDQQGGGRVCVCMYACACMCTCVFVFCVLAPVFWLAQARLENFLHCLGLVVRGIETAAGTLVPFGGHKTIIIYILTGLPLQCLSSPQCCTAHSCPRFCSIFYSGLKGVSCQQAGASSIQAGLQVHRQPLAMLMCMQRNKQSC